MGEGIAAGMSGTGGAGAGTGVDGRRGAAQDAPAKAMQQEKTLMVDAFILKNLGCTCDSEPVYVIRMGSAPFVGSRYLFPTGRAAGSRDVY